MSLKKKRILFVVEGLRREMGIFDNLGTVFFNEKSDVITLPVPADMNIYMLYAAMKKDDFETDVMELLKERIPAAKKILEPYCRDDFAEVYFFFDFDAHSNNLHEMDNVDALREMLEKLNNETEMGKVCSLLYCLCARGPREKNSPACNLPLLLRCFWRGRCWEYAFRDTGWRKSSQCCDYR